MTQPFRIFLLLAAMHLSGGVAFAQGFAGSDDFSGTAAKWSYAFRRDDSLPSNGQLTVTGGALEFTKGPGAGSYILGWDSDPANTTSRIVASYTSHWVMDITAGNTATTAAGEFATTGMQVASDNGSYTAIMLGSSGGSRWVRVESNSIRDAGTQAALANGESVNLRLAWNAAAKNLIASYSVDGGTTYTVLATIGISRWPTQPTGGFFFELFGNSNAAAALNSGQVSLDNFSLQAATIAGADDFGAGTGKWAATYRTPEAGSNGLLTFTAGRVEFTKGPNLGGYHYFWDGDGIANNGIFQTPLSYSTSWVMEATVRNSVIADAGKYASIGIEVATAPGSYADMLLENFGGQLMVLGEVNSPDNFEAVNVPGAADVRLRVSWDALRRELTGAYSLNGAAFATLAIVPISDFPVSPAAGGFIFSITAEATASASIGAGQMWIDDFSIVAAPAIAAQPVNHAPQAGATISLTAAVADGASVAWEHNGVVIPGATGGTLTIAGVEPADAGLYRGTIAGSGGSTLTEPAIVGVTTGEKVIGTGEEIGFDIVHANGNTFDQVLLKGQAATFTADSAKQQITRMSYIDRNHDIVQVEFSGAGTVSVVLDDYSGAARPVNYEQAVDYVKGHAAIVVTGANATTNLSVFTVGRATAVNQTLFKSGVTYDGLADVAFIAISSTDGQFGGLRAANVRFSDTKGLTGVYAPGVQFGLLFVGDIDAAENASPLLLIGGTGDARITGGDLRQTNGRAVQVSGLTQLQFTAGVTSHYVPSLGTNGLIPAQANQGVLEENGLDVTAELAPAP